MRYMWVESGYQKEINDLKGNYATNNKKDGDVSFHRDNGPRVKLSPLLICSPRQGGVEIQLHAFLTWALNGGLVSFTSRPLCPRERKHDTGWKGFWADPQSRFGRTDKE
jgi:hypothetical protein